MYRNGLYTYFVYTENFIIWYNNKEILNKRSVNKISYNPELRSGSELVDDKTLVALLSFIALSQAQYNIINPNNESVANSFVHGLAENFSLEHDLNAHQQKFIEEILHEQFVFDQHRTFIKDDIQQNNDPANNDHEETTRAFEKMKEFVRPNLESAVINYIKFVQPFEDDEEQYEKELEIFREHQMRYLTEDLGIIDPREKIIAMEALMALFPQDVAKTVPKRSQNIQKKQDNDTVQKNEVNIQEQEDSLQRAVQEKSIAQKQKDLVRPLVKKTLNAFMQIPQDDAQLLTEFWGDVAYDMRSMSDLQGSDMDRAIAGLQAIVEDYAQKNSKKMESQTKDPSIREVRQGDKINEDEFFTHNDLVFTGEIAHRLRTLHKDAMEKKALYEEKNEKLHASRDVIARGGIAGQVWKNDDIDLFLQDSIEAQATFDRALEEAKKVYESKDVSQEQDEKKFENTMRVYDAKTTSRMALLGEKFKGIVTKISDWYHSMPRITKRIAVSTFLVAGLVGGAIGDRQHNISDIIAQADQTSTAYTQVIDQGRDVPVSVQGNENNINKQLSSSHKESLEYLEANENTSGHIDRYNNVVDDRVTVDTMVVEKGGSIEGVISQGLIKHYAQIAREGGIDGKADDAYIQKWAGAQAHIIAQKYAKAHSSIAIDRVGSGTRVYLDLDDPHNISIDIAFSDGPHIVPERQKINKEQKDLTQSMEIEHIRTLLKMPEFNAAVKDQLQKVFAVSSLVHTKEIAVLPLQNFFEKDADDMIKKRLHAIIDSAVKIYGSSGAPSHNATVQNYFIRLYAKAQRDHVVEEIFIS